MIIGARSFATSALSLFGAIRWGRNTTISGILTSRATPKTWMAGTSPAMTMRDRGLPRGFFVFPFIPRRIELSAIALYALP